MIGPHSPPTASAPPRPCAERAALAALLLSTAALYGWNAWLLPVLTGYDEPGHIAYLLTLVRDGRLPHPTEGWSTFHPPVYYLAGAWLWPRLEGFGETAIAAGLRAVGAVATLAAGGAAYAVARRFASAPVAWVATALTLLVPCRVLGVGMIGNEALAAAFAGLALPALVRLQRDPGDVRAAAFAGLAAGLAFATKYTGSFTVAACAVPFLRPDLDRRSLRALAVLALVGAAIAGPPYARNLALTGRPFPMTRTREPMVSVESSLVVRAHRPMDYVWFPIDVFRHPTVYPRLEENRRGIRLNESMQSVPAMTYAGIWYDAFSIRIAPFSAEGGPLGPTLLLLGLAPTLATLAGAALAARDAARTRLRALDAPLAVQAGLALVAYVVFTWKAPSLAAAKAAYLLPAGVAAAAFFARGVDVLRARPALRAGILGLSAAAALASAAAFTEGVAFHARRFDRADFEYWRAVAGALPGRSHAMDAYDAFQGQVAPAPAAPR